MLLGLRSRWRGLFVAWLVYGQLRDRQATPTTSQTLKAMQQRNQGNACGKGFWGELPLLISCYNNGILEDESKQKASIVDVNHSDMIAQEVTPLAIKEWDFRYDA